MDLRKAKTIKRELERTVAHARGLRQKPEDGDHVQHGVVVPGCQRHANARCISISSVACLIRIMRGFGWEGARFPFRKMGELL